MKRIILSIGSLVFAGAILASGTGAFLEDAQTSTGNTFASGLITMLYDNESYYTNDSGKIAVSTSTSWTLSKLAGKLFFNFPDIKPGDIGEDTISVHTNNNNAWLCMKIKQTTAATTTAALTSDLHFVFWADDGDNIYEKGEHIFKQGLAKDLFSGESWALADSQTNIWGVAGPMVGGSTKYIGKAWCFGTMTPNPVVQDGKGKIGTNGPLARSTGFLCNGQPVGNSAQGLTLRADVSFNAIQSRNNDAFLCGDSGDFTSSTSTLFFENFNDCSKDAGNNDHEFHNDSWSKKWDCHVSDGEKECTQNAILTAGGNDHTDSLTTPSINATGHHSIMLSYDRTTSGGAQTKLVIDYSVNGGGNWNTLETVTGNSPLTTKTFSLSPLADNKPNAKIRFTLTGANASNQVAIDNVTVTGVTP